MVGVERRHRFRRNVLDLTTHPPTKSFAKMHHQGGHIFLGRPCATQALERLLLQYAQEFRLQRRRNITHLVQKKRAFVSQLKTSNLLRYGSGECSFLMAKKFTFE